MIGKSLKRQKGNKVDTKREKDQKLKERKTQTNRKILKLKEKFKMKQGPKSKK